MPNSYEIAFEINVYLDSREEKRHGELADLATSYAALCREANDRLKRCGDFLRRGLRTEAIYHADVEPDLIDLVAGLDLPRIAEWNAVCDEQQLERAPALLLEIAAEVNQAYAAMASVDGLLSRLRHLSIERAPLRRRLGVLRSLAALDPGSGLLEQDARDYEAARITEIRREAGRAAQSKNLARVRDLLAELTEDAWRTSVPAELIDRLRGIDRNLVAEQAAAMLNALLPKLHTAYNALAYEECEPLLKRWYAIIAAGQLAVPEELAVQVAPIIAWADSEEQERRAAQQFMNACSALALALDDRAPIRPLQKLHAQAHAFDQPLSAELEQAYRTRIAELELTQRRKHRVLLVAAAASLAVVGVAVGLLVRWSIHNARVEGVVEEVTAAIAATDLDGAGARLERFKQEYAGLAGRPRIERLEADLARARQAEADRVTAFRKYMERAIARGTETPDYEALKLAGEIAQRGTVAERLEHARFKGDCKRVALLAQTKRDEDFNTRVAALTAEYEDLDRRAIRQGSVRAVEALEALNHRSGTLLGTPDITPTIKAVFRPVAGRIATDLQEARDTLNASRAEAVRLAEQERDLDALKGKVGSAQALQAALTAFATEHPSSKKAAAFVRAAQQWKDWAAAEEWKALVDTWGAGLVPPGVSILAERVTAVEACLKGCPTSPVGASLQAYLVYLNKTRAAFADDSKWKVDLPDIMESPIMKLRMLEMKDGRRYYSPSDAVATKASDTHISIEVVTTKDMKTKTLLFESAQIARQSALSPQTKFAVAVLAKMADFRLASWHTFGFDIAQMVLDHPDIDPILQAQLLGTILTYIRDCGWGAETEVGEDLGRLGRLNRNANFLDPTDEAAKSVRPLIRKALARLRSFSDLKKQVEARRQTLFRSLSLNWTGRGFAILEDANWTVRTPVTTFADGWTLWVVAPAATGTGTAFRKIGRVARGEIVVNDAAMLGVHQGTMVFFRRAAGD